MEIRVLEECVTSLADTEHTFFYCFVSLVKVSLLTYFPVASVIFLVRLSGHTNLGWEWIN